MEKLDAFDPDEGTMELWLKQFELRCSLLDMPGVKKAQWCRSVVGPQVQEALANLSPAAEYDELKEALLRAYGVTNEIREVQDALANLSQVSMTLKQLAARVQYLTNTVLRGADEEVRKPHAIRAFLKALPRGLAREVERACLTTLEELRQEMERQLRLRQEDARQEPGKVAALSAPAPEAAAALGHGHAPPGACFHCHQVGHFRRECPHRRRLPQPLWSGPPAMHSGTYNLPPQVAAWFVSMFQMSAWPAPPAGPTGRGAERGPLALPAPPAHPTQGAAILAAADDGPPLIPPWAESHPASTDTRVDEPESLN